MFDEKLIPTGFKTPLRKIFGQPFHVYHLIKVIADSMSPPIALAIDLSLTSVATVSIGLRIYTHFFVAHKRNGWALIWAIIGWASDFHEGRTIRR